jgi:hypothetical protein
LGKKISSDEFSSYEKNRKEAKDCLEWLYFQKWKKTQLRDLFEQTWKNEAVKQLWDSRILLLLFPLPQY